MSEKSEKRSERMSEYLLSEASSLLRQVAGNRRADESKKAVLRRVGRVVKDWTPSRIKDVWYCDKRVRIRASEVEQLRMLVSQREKSKADVDELVATLHARVERLESLLEATAPPPNGAGVPASGLLLGKVGREPGAMDRPHDRE